MADLYLIHKILTIVGELFGFFCVFLVYFSDRHSKINKYFSIACLSYLILWGHNFFTISFVGRYSLDYATWLMRLGYAGGATSVIAFFYFVIYFPKESEVPRWMKKAVNYIYLFLFFFAFTPYFLKTATFNAQGVLEGGIFGWGKYIFNLGLLLTGLIVIIFIFKKYLYLNNEDKDRVRYFLFGFFTFAITNLIGNVFLPIITSRASPVGTYSFLVLLGFTALGILKYRLFEIKALLTDFLVGVMGTALATQIFFEQNSTMRAIGLIIFFLFCVIGYILVQAIHREVKTNEILEHRVKERTKDLERSRDIAEERAREIEKWYHLTVGRELRMAELKDKIKELEGKKRQSLNKF